MVVYLRLLGWRAGSYGVLLGDQLDVGVVEAAALDDVLLDDRSHFG